MIRTGQQFLESIRDGRRVLCGGEMIDDLTTHPKTRGYAHALAEYYDMHHDPEHQDVMTFVDENGERWAKHWFLPRNKEDLVARREYHDYVFRNWARGAMFTRPPASMLPVFYTLYQDPEPWESESQGHDGRPLAQNIRDKWDYLKSNDFSASPMFLDVQGDRSDPDSLAETPMLRMVDKNDQGIVVRGWKAIGTGVAFANEIFMGVLWKPGAVSEQIVFANDSGVTHVVRPSLADPDADPYDRPLASRGDELDGMAYFDDVLIPWDRVFHVGNPDHAKFYPQRLFDFGRAYYLENVTKMIETLIDFCGRGVVVYPNKADLDNPELGGALRSALRGHNTSAEDRTKMFRMIHERFLTEWGARHAMFEKFNGTPLWVIKLLTMQRVEYQADGPLTELARNVLGLRDVSGLAQRADEEKADYPSIRVRPEYIKKQDVATTQDVSVSA
jgi:4-hydroxyphenylacetate 3-monooxygenase